MSEDLVDTDEDEGIKNMVSEMGKNEDEEEDDKVFEDDDNGKSDDEDLNMTMEDMVRKKYAAKNQTEPILTPVSPVQQQTEPINPTQTQSEPEKDKSPSPITTTTKTPTPPQSPALTKSLSPKATQPEQQPEKEPTKSPTPSRENIPTPPTEPILDTSNVVFEKKTLQVIEEDPLEEEEEEEEEETTSEEGQGQGPDQSATGAAVLSASASQEIQTVTIISKNKEDTVKLVLEKLAAKKREELGNTQKFFKSIADLAKIVQETSSSKGADAAKETETSAEKEGNQEGFGVETTIEVEATKEDQPKGKKQEKQAEIAVGEQLAETATKVPMQFSADASDAYALPKDDKAEKQPAAAVNKDVTASKAATSKPKETNAKKQKVTHVPTRSSNRLKSGAKIE